MNIPLSGSTFRSLGVPIEELKVHAQNNPNMTVRVNEGSYYTARMKLVEFEGGTSPTIQAPATGYKWVVVGITPLGTIFVSSGEIKNRAPELPAIEKNMLPLAAIYLGANSTAITQDMIEDIRPFLASGYHPGDHTILDNCDQPNLHPISSITDLQGSLDSKATKEDLERFSEKIDEVSGTSSAVFTLNNAQTGMPTTNVGISVCRGSEPNVGLRYNERKGTNNGIWEFTNDGVTWNEIPTALSIDGQLKKASANTDGVVRLSVDPEDALAPVAVATNDPRLAKIDIKADAESVYDKDEIDEMFVGVLKEGDTYTRENLDNILDGKADVDSVYSRSQIDQFMRGKINVGDAYIKSDVDNLLLEKADLTDTYSIAEADAKLAEKADADSVYSKESVDILVDAKADADSVYTKEEVDEKFADVQISLEEATTKYDEYIEQNDVLVAAKADTESVYSKEEIDEKLDVLTDKANTLDTAFTEYAVSADERIDAKAEAADTYTKHQVDDFIATKVNNDEFDQLENNVASLQAAFNTTLTDVAASIVTQTEYQKDFRATQDIFGQFRDELDEVQQNLSEVTQNAAGTQQELNEYKTTNDAQVALKASQSDLDTLTQTVANNKQSLEDDLATKADKDDVYTKAEVDAKFDDANNAIEQLNNNSATKAELNSVANGVYTKDEVDAILVDMYTKDEVNAKINEAIEQVLQQIREEINN